MESRKRFVTLLLLIEKNWNWTIAEPFKFDGVEKYKALSRDTNSAPNTSGAGVTHSIFVQRT